MTYLKICPKCGHKEFGAHYCTQCGTWTIDNPDVPRCPKCRCAYGKDERFCAMCGWQFKAQAE